MKVSKMVIDRQRSAGKVEAAALTHGPKVRDGVTALFNDAEMGLAAERLMTLSATELSRATQTMVVADEANIAELDDDEPIRQEKDAATSDTRSVVIDLRDIAGTLFGNEYVRALGFEGDTPTDSVTLQRLAERVLERLDAMPMPEARFDGIQFEVAPWREKLAAPLTRLTAAVSNMNIEKREAEQTLNAKTTAIAEYDAIFSKTAGLISALLRAAGEAELADRVRPARSRPGQIFDPDVEVGDEAPESTDPTAE